MAGWLSAFWDGESRIRDLYYPQIGLENHVEAIFLEWHLGRWKIRWVDGSWVLDGIHARKP